MKYLALLLFVILALLFIVMNYPDGEPNDAVANKTINRSDLEVAENHDLNNSTEPSRDDDNFPEKQEQGGWDYESIQSQECLDLKKQNPEQLNEYYALMEQYGLGREDMLNETSFNNLPIESLIQLSNSDDLKAKYVLGIYYIWQGGTGINYFKDLNEETRDKEIDTVSLVKNHKLNDGIVNKGQELLFDAAVGGKYLALQEILVGQKFKLKKLAGLKDNPGFQRALSKYIEVLELTNFVFTARAKKSLSPSYYDKATAINQLTDMYPVMMEEVELPVFRKDTEIPIISKWKKYRYERGYLDMHFDLSSDMASFAERMEVQCWGL